MAEYLDVLNDNMQPVGVATREINQESFLALLQGSQSNVEALGFEYNDSGVKEEKRLLVGLSDFAAQGDAYYDFVFKAIAKASQR